jgi:hypothetical protein
VDLGIWCPPTFVGNSGIERSNGDRGFALSFLLHVYFFVMPGLVPGIYVFSLLMKQDVDGRDKPGHDGD